MGGKVDLEILDLKVQLIGLQENLPRVLPVKNLLFGFSLKQLQILE